MQVKKKNKEKGKKINFQINFRLANALGANIKIQTSTMPFKMMENIEAYLKFCSSCGLRTHDLFQTVDLYEAKNLNQV